jgi:hypothetical protein
MKKIDRDGEVAIRKRVSRAKLLEFFARLPPCVIGIEACPTAHHWNRAGAANVTYTTLLSRGAKISRLGRGHCSVKTDFWRSSLCFWAEAVIYFPTVIKPS